MRTTLSVVAIIFAASALSGCNTVTKGDFETGQALMSESPTMKRLVMKDCIADSRNDSPKLQKEMAAVLNVPVSSYAPIFCKRLLNAYASRRISYTDYIELRAGRGDEKKIVRILQGK